MSCSGRVRSESVRLGKARLPGHSGGRRLMVRWMEEVAELLPILDKRLHVSRCLSRLIVGICCARLRELSRPGPTVAVVSLGEDQFRAFGFKEEPAQRFNLVAAVVEATAGS